MKSKYGEELEMDKAGNQKTTSDDEEKVHLLRCRDIDLSKNWSPITQSPSDKLTSTTMI